MGLSVTNEGVNLVDQWLSRYKDNGLTKRQVKDISRLLIATLSVDSRWVKVQRKDLNTYTGGKHKPGNFDAKVFTINKDGKDVKYKVKCELGHYWLERTNAKSVVAGWHPDIINQIKEAKIELPKDVPDVLFNLGQTIINDRQRKYRN